MSKVAIVGVEGSGKTVLMAAFGEKYVAPDENGVFLDAVPETTTFDFVHKVSADMREGKWPQATPPHSVSSLDWRLCRREGKKLDYLCDISFLDFGGELYRYAFGASSEKEREPYREQIGKLMSHIDGADALVVLLNLKDVINGHGNDQRTMAMLKATRGIVDHARSRLPSDRVLLVFSQYETFRTIVESEGGLRATYAKHLPFMLGPYPDLPLAAVSAVDRTVLTPEGYEVPASDFASSGLDTLMDWIVADVESRHRKHWCRRVCVVTAVLAAVAVFGWGVAAAPFATATVVAVLGLLWLLKKKICQLHAGSSRTIKLPGGVEMEMIYCPPGEFMMGSPDSETERSYDETQHHVKITKGFWIGKYPVTIKQWKSVMGGVPSELYDYYCLRGHPPIFCRQGECCPSDPDGHCCRLGTSSIDAVMRSPDDSYPYPVRRVSWNDCQKFIERINSQFKCGARFPTEAEWEYACRAGSKGAYAGKEVLDEMGWYRENSTATVYVSKPGLIFDKIFKIVPQEHCIPPAAGHKSSNAWGVFDMHGNVREWCGDWYEIFYQFQPECDPQGPQTGDERVVRGGSYVDDANFCRSASRARESPSCQNDYIGFRLCCSAEPIDSKAKWIETREVKSKR